MKWSLFPFVNSGVSALNNISVRHGLLYCKNHEGFQSQCKKNKDKGVFLTERSRVGTHKHSVHSVAYSISFITLEKYLLLYYWSVSYLALSQTCHMYFLTNFPQESCMMDVYYSHKICEKNGL